ncbi:tRNA 2-selenouridine(34) synthase MnmH [Lyngbya aestuarii]|uniref:tRNA 2-selenouridine(34) synthase MnmH n=1 Tax=Lyngbya aestuarii TaxID=118322 RepID=UPI00403D6266
MSQPLAPAEFLNTPGVVLDVRSPAEYAQGHIPGAISFPLFNDDERAKVGICYKHQGHETAVELGFAIAGPKFAGFIAQAKVLAPHRQVRLYCWRGGMRSAAVAWVLETGGLDVSLLVGGYKAFRRWSRSLLAIPQKMIILGGMTGTGKTNLLTVLANQGEQVLDLEGIASHRGSSYGGLGLPPQPTNEQFWNLITLHWASLNRHVPVWIEAESKRIGCCCIPEEIFQQMELAPLIQVSRPRQERLALLVDMYGDADINQLATATERIGKRLGGLRTKQAISLLREGKLAQAFDIILEYYDKTYCYDLQQRNLPIHSLDISGLSSEEGAVKLLETARQVLSSTGFQSTPEVTTET